MTRCTTGTTPAPWIPTGFPSSASSTPRDKLVGRGLLLDIARWKKVDALKDGEGISNDDLDACAAAQKVQIRKGDFVIVRTGQMEACNKRGEWGGYAGGDAPGLKFESCYWLQEKEVAGVCSDTWGVEVRPNETKDVNQPWHWVVIPAMGLYMGEMFQLKELAEDCAKDKVYEFFFSAGRRRSRRRHSSRCGSQAVRRMPQGPRSARQSCSRAGSRDRRGQSESALCDPYGGAGMARRGQK